MAGRDAARVAGDRLRAGTVATDQARGLAQRREVEIVRILLPPLDRCPLAVDTQPQAIFIARCDLTGPQHAARSVAIPEHDMNIVIELPPRHIERSAATSRHCRPVTKAARW